MAKTSTSREINGKNKYIKGEKWQKQGHQGREMAILNRSKQQLLSETYSQSDPPLTFLLFFSCLLFISPDSFNVLLGANMPTESEVQSRSHFISTFIPPQQPNISCIKFLISDIVFVTD